MHIVQSYVKAKGMIPADQVAQEVDLFYNHLGIDDMYFEQETPESVGDNIVLLYGAKIQALIRNEAHPEIDLMRQRDESGVFIHTSHPGLSHPKNYEALIDSRYLDTNSSETPYRIESYLSTGKVSEGGKTLSLSVNI